MSRFRYWIILLAEGPTTFRSRDPETLVPTLTQLRRTHPEAVLKWFEGGKLWDSPEEAAAAGASPPERRPRDWRPGGEHRDPKAAYKKPPREVRKRRIIERMRQKEAQKQQSGPAREEPRWREDGRRKPKPKAPWGRDEHTRDGKPKGPWRDEHTRDARPKGPRRDVRRRESEPRGPAGADGPRKPWGAKAARPGDRRPRNQGPRTTRTPHKGPDRGPREGPNKGPQRGPRGPKRGR